MTIRHDRIKRRVSRVGTAAMMVVASACSAAQSPRLAQPVVLPFELRNDLALLHVSVNGHDATLILDSGSGALVLDSAFARVAGVGTRASMSASANGRTPIRLAQTDSVAVGGALLTNVRTAIVDLSPVTRRLGHDVQGTLGYELFARFVVDVDYQSRTVTLMEPADFHYTGSGAAIPIRLVNNLPSVDARIVTRNSGTVNARLHLDLGSASYALRLSRKFLLAHPLDSDTTTVPALLGAGVGGADQGHILRLPQLLLGALTIDRPSTALSDAATGPFGAASPTDGTIGVPVFRRTRVTFDYSRARVYIEPRASLATPDSVDASGLVLAHPDSSDRVWMVDDVIPGSAADGAGIRAGDRLAALDGQAVATMSPQQLREQLRRAGQPCTITVQRGQTTRSVRVLLRPIV